MDISILQLIEGAKRATGLAVIIDVFRAFSTACYVIDRGAAAIVPVGDIETAYRLKREHPDYVLMGERGGVMQPGFDFGNSPTHAERADFTGRTVVHTTSAGTQGIANAAGADEVITGSFVNAGAIVRYIQARRPERVSLVCMGLGGAKPADEDTLCAEYLRNALEGKPNDFAAVVRYLREESRTGSFMDLTGEATETSAPKSDFERCLDLDRFPFVLKVVPFGDGLKRLEKVMA
ncbi:2-phosphosulfolactate phosphatase [Paenibacillus sp.]|uniref:2-phosphosulfolactate phosphatase n=1 Tax=Paenibacillus sp. TaxID=58172 RepID=UPI002D5CDFD2|nr:2-phosphosulfolactate phosphatase [Paenibacillus sp.]HZG54908.1 2-phosphosulfolactate phosphatase [Paenibacillus sp.]